MVLDPRPVKYAILSGFPVRFSLVLPVGIQRWAQEWQLEQLKVGPEARQNWPQAEDHAHTCSSSRTAQMQEEERGLV